MNKKINIYINFEINGSIEKIIKEIDITSPLKYVPSSNYTDIQKLFLGLCGFIRLFELDKLLKKLNNNITKISIIKSNINNELRNSLVKIKEECKENTQCKDNIKNDVIKSLVTFTVYDNVERELKNTTKLIQTGMYITIFLNNLLFLIGMLMLFKIIIFSSTFILILFSIVTTLFIMSIFGYSEEYFKNFEMNLNDFQREVSLLKYD